MTAVVVSEPPASLAWASVPAVDVVALESALVENVLLSSLAQHDAIAMPDEPKQEAPLLARWGRPSCRPDSIGADVRDGVTQDCVVASSTSEDSCNESIDLLQANSLSLQWFC